MVALSRKTGRVTASASAKAAADRRCRLYLITPERIALQAFAETLKRALDGGDVACLQLRLKDVSDDEVKAAAEKLMPIAQSYGVATLINDRPDLAFATGADGVHIGQDDVALAEARRVLGASHIVGVTCHASRHLAMEAGEGGADYVAFGAFYPSATKPAKYRASAEILTWWSELFEIPCVAIGGITAENAPPLIAAGADFLAVSNAVWSHPLGPTKAVGEFNLLFADTLTEMAGSRL